MDSKASNLRLRGRARIHSTCNLQLSFAVHNAVWWSSLTLDVELWKMTYDYYYYYYYYGNADILVPVLMSLCSYLIFQNSRVLLASFLWPTVVSKYVAYSCYTS